MVYIPVIVAYNARSSIVSSRKQARNMWQAELCLAYSLNLKTFLRNVGGLFVTIRCYILEDNTFPRIYRQGRSYHILCIFYCDNLCSVTVIMETSEHRRYGYKSKRLSVEWRSSAHRGLFIQALILNEDYVR